MKNLIYLTAITLTLVTYSLNATSPIKPEIKRLEAPLQKFVGFKKDISSAD
ncbi:hypothetical protein [Mucilaginibacter gynuensis]|uniref:hypothetical protein n=1 Tax=Mucilaginibacter gynuensis TaxID=1302236 RepID=UPI0031E620D8